MSDSQPATATFALNGIDLRVTAETDKQIRYLRGLVGALERTSNAPETYSWSIRGSEDDVTEPDWPISYSGPMLEEIDGTLRQRGSELALDIPDHVSALIAPDHAAAVVKPGREPYLGGTVAVLVLEAALIRTQQYLVHAACLETRDRSGTILIFAPSGTGKTTTSLILARSGFPLAGDDTTILMRRPNDFRAWALPRAFHVHRNTVALLPWLTPAIGPWRENDDEQFVSKDAVGDLIALSDGHPKPVRAVIVLGERTNADHVMERMGKAEALIALACDNVPAGPLGIAQRKQALFETIADTIGQTPTYALNVGKNVDTVGDLITKTIE